MKTLKQGGFTIAELAVVVVMAGIIAILIGGITNAYYGSILRAEAEARMVVDSQIILRNIVDELRVASGIRTTNQLFDAYQPPAGWNTSSDEAILIIETPIVSSTNEFILDSDTGEFFKNEIIYFADGKNMYRRVITDPDAPKNDRRESCPIDNVGTGTCEVADSTLSNDYEIMNFIFYDQDNQVTSVVEQAESIEMTINLGRTIFKKPVGIENNIRITLRN